MIYCHKCGAICDDIASTLYNWKKWRNEEYDQQTGNRLTRAVCPTGECEHEGIWHKYDDESWWKILLRGRVCTVCGKREHASTDD